MTTARDTFNRQVITYRKSIAAHKFLVPTETLVADILQSIRMTLTHGSKEGTNQATLMLVAAIAKAATEELVDWSATTGEDSSEHGDATQKEDADD